MLTRLAQLYQCGAGDLLADIDFSDLDPVNVRVQPLWPVCGTCGAIETG